MHFEILVEDQSGKKALQVLVPKIIGKEHTFEIHSYKGAGRLPSNLKPKTDANKRILLDQLPQKLRGYGKTFVNQQGLCAVIIVCDLDDRNKDHFYQELMDILDGCNPRPETRFCIAIEELEAWFLGDVLAIKAAYPKAKNHLLKQYKNDSICGTWEYLAEAIVSGGLKMLKNNKDYYRVVGTEKSQWAEKITPHMDIDRNESPSFKDFVKKLRELIENPL